MKSKMYRLTIILLVVVAVPVAATIWYTVPTAGKDYTVRVGYKRTSAYQIYLVAQSQRLFEKHGVTVEGVTFNSTDQMLQALALDRLDATAGGSLEVAASLAATSPGLLRVCFTNVLREGDAFYSIVVPPDSRVHNLAGLSGKKVAVLPGSTASAWLKVCLKSEGIDPSSVQLVQMSPELQLQALNSGRVDALYAMDPLVAIARVKGLGRVAVKGPETKHIMSPMPCAGGVLSMTFLKRNPILASQYCAAMDEAIDFMRAKPAETRKIIAELTKLDPSVAEQMALLEYWKIDETNFESVQNYLAFLVAHGILKTEISARNLYIDATAIK